jgi:hypothetical protein
MKKTILLLLLAAALGRIQFADGRTGKVGQTSDGYVRAIKGLIISFF